MRLQAETSRGFPLHGINLSSYDLNSIYIIQNIVQIMCMDVDRSDSFQYHVYRLFILGLQVNYISTFSRTYRKANFKLSLLFI